MNLTIVEGIARIEGREVKGAMPAWEFAIYSVEGVK